MPKGEASPRIHRLNADALEERWLLSHGTVGSSVHPLTTTPSSQVSTLTTVSRSEVDSSHSGSSNAGDLQERDSDVVTAAALAASTVSKDQYTIPLVISTRINADSDDGSTNAGGILASSRNLRVVPNDEHVAWGGAGSNASNLVTMVHLGPELTPAVPETSLGQLDNDKTGPIEGDLEKKGEFEETLSLAVARGADLLAPYLPVDGADLDRAIDRLLDGIEVLGQEMAGGEGSPVELIPLPIAWGIGLAAVELIRRRLRPQDDEADDTRDRDPALGFHGVPG